jgi:hypothetical protein
MAVIIMPIYEYYAHAGPSDTASSGVHAIGRRSGLGDCVGAWGMMRLYSLKGGIATAMRRPSGHETASAVGALE